MPPKREIIQLYYWMELSSLVKIFGSTLFVSSLSFKSTALIVAKNIHFIEFIVILLNIYYVKINQRAIIQKCIGRVMVLVQFNLSHRHKDIFQVWGKCLVYFSSYVAFNIREKNQSKGNNSKITLGRVMVLVQFNLSHRHKAIFQVWGKCLVYFSRYDAWRTKFCDGRTKKSIKGQ